MPAARCGPSFASTSMPSWAMGQYSGEGMHSFRRGKIQAAAAAGADDAAIKTRSVRQVYLRDPS